MSDETDFVFILKKLGHDLEEVRVRALKSILSKLKRGFIALPDLAKSKYSLVKLLEWFGYKPCTHQEEVLELILHILQENEAENLVAHIGAAHILEALSAIRTELPANLHPLLDEIVALVTSLQLGSKQSEDYYNPIDRLPEDLNADPTLMQYLIDNNNLDLKLQDSSNPTLCTDSEFGGPEFSSFQTTVSVPSSYALKYLLLPWQPLISTDRHVLIAVQESLENTDNRTQLLHTCNFLRDVMMRDFPAEIFIQRPAILMTFIKLLKGSLFSSDRHLGDLAIDCLSTLTVSLHSRLKYYQDSNLANLKQENFLSHFGGSSSLISVASSVPSLKEGTKVAETQIHPNMGDWSNSSSQHSTSPIDVHAQGDSVPPDHHIGGFHYNTTQASSENTDSEDSVLLQLQQCSLPQFCALVFRHALPHIDAHFNVGLLLGQLTQLLTECVTPQLWLAPASDAVATDIATLLHQVLGVLGEFLQQKRSSGVSRIVHLQLLSVCRFLLNNLVPLEIADKCLPRPMKTALCNNIFDGALHAFYPNLHFDLLKYVQVFKNVRDVESFRSFEDVLSVAESLRKSAIVLQEAELDGANFIMSTEQALPALLFHQDMSFISTLLDKCSKNMYSWKLLEKDKRSLSTVLLKLLAHSDLEIRSFTYVYLHKLVLESLSVRQPRYPAAQSLTFLLFDTNILLEIINHGISCLNDKVSDCATDIVVHLLKSHALLDSQDWTRFLSCLAPTLPLLHCWAEKNTNLGHAIITMLNPDVGSKINLPSPELLKGNLRLLFSKDRQTRVEAMSRLLWMLTREEDAFQKRPSVGSLHNYAFETICLIDQPVDVLHNVPSEPFYQETDMLQVLEVVQPGVAEPSVFVSALKQLSVMLEDPRLHRGFISNKGLQIAVNALHQSMCEKNYSIYPEAAVPAVGILRHLCLHQSLSRHHLAQDIDIFYSILRGLLLFSTNPHVRLHSSQLLVLLLYNDVILSTNSQSNPDGTIVRAISLPNLIVQHMHLPFLCPSHWRTSHFTEPVVSDILIRQEASKSFLRMAWNLCFFQGDVSPLLWKSKASAPTPVIKAQEKFSQLLQMSQEDLETIQSSAMLSTCRKQLELIKLASTHQDVIKALYVLKSVLNLRKLLGDKVDVLPNIERDAAFFDEQYSALPWSRALRRFLVAAPASLEDQHLLVNVLKFLQIHVQTLRSISNSSNDVKWLFGLLAKPSNPLPNMLHSVAHAAYAESTETHRFSESPKWKEVCRELLSVISECAVLENCIREMRRSSGPQPVLFSSDSAKESNKTEKKSKKKNSEESRPTSRLGSEINLQSTDRWVDEVVAGAAEISDSGQVVSWAHVIQNVIGCLKSSDTQHFYNLAFLDWLLWALVHLTALPGWSSKLNATDAKKLFSEMLSGLLELVQAFHLECGKGGSSCMGLSITRGAILCLNHLLFETQSCQELMEWERLWGAGISTGLREGGPLVWLSSLWQSREAVIRGAAMQLAAGISSTYEGYTTVLDPDEPGFWMAPLYLMLDNDEATAVREQCAILLTNIIRNLLKSTPKSGKVSSAEEMTVLPAFLDIVKQISDCEFSSALGVILSRLLLSVGCEPHQYITGTAGVALRHAVIVTQGDQEAGADTPAYQYVVVYNRPGSPQDSHEITKKHVATTPAFVRSLCNFLDSLMRIGSEDIQPIFTQSLASQLLRGIDAVPSFSNNDLKGRLLYSDTVRMYAGICRVVTHCVAADKSTSRIILQQPDTAHKLLSILIPTPYYHEASQLQKLRNEVWTEVLRLLTALLSNSERDEEQSSDGKDMYSSLHAVLIRSQGEPLMSVLNIALSGSVHTDLQGAALACVYALLIHPASRPSQPFACLLDNPDIDLNSSVLPGKEEGDWKNGPGAELCRALIHLYEVHNLHTTTAGAVEWRKRYGAVAAALCALLVVSMAAKQVALQHGLLELLHTQMLQLQSRLALDPIETMRRISDKKKVSPLLQDVELVMELMTSMACRDNSVKQLAADIGVADVIHKLWLWCSHHHSLLLSALRLLTTLTCQCLPASHSLVLTTTVPGLSLRRSPSCQSLLNALVDLVMAETEKPGNFGNISDSTTVLKLSINIVLNACHVPECRVVLTKGNLLRATRHLHSGRKGSHSVKVETLWLQLLLQLSAFQEGQVVLPKVPDLLDYFMKLAKGTKNSSKMALKILRNIAFHSINRPHLLSSGNFLQLLNEKIREGDTEDQVASASALWALIANNQKAKLIAKCAGTDVTILDALRGLVVSQLAGSDYAAQLLNCVLRVLRSGSTD